MDEWKEIIERHGPGVWHTAYRLLADDADAADCYQETFLAAWQLSKRQPVRNISALLTRIATSRAIDRLRQRYRQSAKGMNPLDVTVLPSTLPGPERRVQDWELSARLRKALTRLPEHEAEVFCLRHLNNMSYRQIAKELGITSNTAGVLLHRARNKLVDFFRQDE